jgi:hypothetical protein
MRCYSHLSDRRLEDGALVYVTVGDDPIELSVPKMRLPHAINRSEQFAKFSQNLFSFHLFSGIYQ